MRWPNGRPYAARMPVDVYLLLGYPGTGKYTVAKALAEELATRGVVGKVVDNHHMNNPIFEVVLADGITPLPARVWDLVEQVRDAVLTAIEECAPAACTYIFTNFVLEAEAAEPEVVAYLDRLRALAKARGGALRVVSLTCEPEELYRRVTQPDRRARHKSIDSSWLRKLVAADPHYFPTGPGVVSLDITDQAPQEAARLIVDHHWP